MGRSLTPPVSPKILCRSGGDSISLSMTLSLKPGAYCSIVSNTETVAAATEQSMPMLNIDYCDNHSVINQNRNDADILIKKRIITKMTAQKGTLSA